MGPKALTSTHPAIVLAYTAIAAIIAMSALQPVLCGIVLACTVAASFWVEGARATFGRLAWQLPMIAFIAALNCLFVQRGATILVDLNIVSLRLEALVFGLCSGAMLASVLSIFSLCGKLVSSDDAMSMFSGRMPALSLTLSITLGLVPRLRRQATDIHDALQANSASGADGPGVMARPSVLGMRALTTLMSDAMEDSLVRADSMRARGWGGSRRTSYRRSVFTKMDGARLAAIVTLGILAGWGSFAACAGSEAYPALVVSSDIKAYAAFAAFFLLPFVQIAVEALRWTR